jgi:hypothetical protein
MPTPARFFLPLHRLVFLGFFGLAGLSGTGFAMATEEPKYQVLASDASIEVRRYAPLLLAEVLVDGDMDDASNQGFRLLANYIFGNNRVETEASSAKIAMTAPVTVTPQSSKISMTAPVTIEAQSAQNDLSDAQQWRVSFVMPNQYTLNNIPKPNNKRVSLRAVPEKYFVVLTYSGFNTSAKVQRLSDDVLAWSQSKNLKVLGLPQLARYNPPWTLPMFRRNEIMLEIAAP